MNSRKPELVVTFKMITCKKYVFLRTIKHTFKNLIVDQHFLSSNTVKTIVFVVNIIKRNVI